MVASASPVERWLLVEIAGPWGRNAFTQSHLDPRIGEGIMLHAARFGLRAVAIRRPGRHAVQETWRWAYADSRIGLERISWGTETHPEALLDLPGDLDQTSADQSPAYLVCTHAKHDRCCAVRGRPVADELARHRPEQTWECSHLGGDRFAGTMAILPHGFYFGRVDEGNVLEVVESYEQGLLSTEFVRGRSSVSPAVQAAQHEVRAQFGDAGIDAYPPLKVQSAGHNRWSVELAKTNGSVKVEVTETDSDPLHATCLSQRLARVPSYNAKISRSLSP